MNESDRETRRQVARGVLALQEVEQSSNYKNTTKKNDQFQSDLILASSERESNEPELGADTIIVNMSAVKHWPGIAHEGSGQKAVGLRV